MNILVIFTGGTIGSIVKGDYISTDSTAEYTLINSFRQLSDIDVSFTTISPYNLLSENLSGTYINKLITCVNEHQNKDYDGIIITHGTDTLQYSAAALSMFLHTTSLPIVFVSSNYVLDDPRANGLDNLISAIHFIEQADVKGVFVAYRNEVAAYKNEINKFSKHNDRINYIYEAGTLLPHAAYNDILYAVDDNYYGIVCDGRFIRNVDYVNTNYNDMVSSPVTLSDISPILYIKPVPGQLFPDIPTGTKAILLDSYHSGTLNTLSGKLHDFVKSATDKSIPVYLTGVEVRTQYESTREYGNLGIIILPKMSPVAAYMLLWGKYSP